MKTTKTHGVVICTSEDTPKDGNIVLCHTAPPQIHKSIEKTLALWHNDVLTESQIKQWYKTQHLYITSDEEIKEGDWIYDTNSLPHNPLIHKVGFVDKAHLSTCDSLHSRGLNCVGKVLNLKHHYRRIVASTDKNLVADYDIKPIPESFLPVFIASYNNRNQITEVDLEMQKACCKSGHILINCLRSCKDVIQIPKTRHDNTVIIHPSRKYSKNEMQQAFRAGMDSERNKENSFVNHIGFDKFIEALK